MSGIFFNSEKNTIDQQKILIEIVCRILKIFGIFSDPPQNGSIDIFSDFFSDINIEAKFYGGSNGSTLSLRKPL